VLRAFRGINGTEGEQVKKSYSPTAKKLKRARKDGDIAKSGELTALLTVVFGLCATGVALVFSQQILINPHNLFNYSSEIEIKVRSIFLLVLVICVLVFGLFCVSAVVEMLQVGFSFNLGLVKPKVSRLNPFSGFKRILGMPEEDSPWSFFQSPVFEALKCVGYWIVTLSCLYFFRSKISRAAINTEPTLQSLIELNSLAIGPVCFFFFGLSLMTLWVARRLQLLRLLMDREELKREIRDSEGREEQKQWRHEAYLELSHRAQGSFLRRAKFVVKRD